MYNIVLRSYGYIGVCEVLVGKSILLYYFKIIVYIKILRINLMFGGIIEVVVIKVIFFV